MPVTLLDPQGQAREIPDDQVQSAMAAGGKRAVKITDPKGTPRWIPEDQKDAALQAGGKLDTSGQRGFLGSLADATGVSSISPSSLVGLVLPGEALSRATEGLLNEGKRVYGEAKAAYSSTNNTDLQRHGTAAIPFVGSGIDEAGKQADQKNYSGAAGTFAGLLANEFGLEFAPGAAAKAAKVIAPPASSAAESIASAASAAKDRIYPTSKSTLPAEDAARNLGKALVVPVKAMPNFVGAATEEAGTIKAYAKANNLPINSTVDLGKAASATAKAVQDHFDSEILGKNAEDVVTAPPDYRGTKLNIEGSRTTLGAINDRINAIRQQMSPAYRNATQGQTSAALVSDADLLAEKRKLTRLLSEKLSDKTGLEVEDIDAIQRQAGKLRTVADEVNLSANTNTTAAGKQAMGRSDIPTGTKMGMIERGVQALRGGPEIIGNRAVNSAFHDINPTELVLKNPRTNPIGAPASNPIPNQGASQMIRPAYNEPMQDYIRRKKAAQAQK